MSDKEVEKVEESVSEVMNPEKSFFEAITAYIIDLNWINHALQENPSLLNAKYHNGLVPIQLASNRGNRDLIRLIAEHGANLEVKNEEDKTPVVLACLSGNLYAVHTLSEYGANMKTEDLYGRTLMHHAASIGAVHIMHYLHEKVGLRYDQKDKEGYTPLLLSVWFDHTDAVRYLLKNKRCGSVAVTNMYGTTPLSVAVKKGNHTMCRLLILSTDENLLLIRDGNGITPVQHAQQGTTLRHKELAKKLLQWTTERISNNSTFSRLFSYDSLIWYLVLIIPGSSITLAAIIFIYLPYLALSLPLCLLLIIFGFFGTMSNHRLPLDSGLQNPGAMGAFISGLILTVICYFSVVLPRLWPSNIIWFTIIAVDYLLIIYFFWKMERTDPGFDRVGKLTEDGTPMTIADIAKQDPLSPHQYYFCTACEIVVPEVTKHCKLCGHCCNGFDHHCLWLMTCIGCKNHRLFVLFLFLLPLDNFLFVRGAVSVLIALTGTYDPWMFLRYGFHYERFLFFLFLCNFLTGLFGTMPIAKAIAAGRALKFHVQPAHKNALTYCDKENLIYQLSIVSKRETTYFDASGKAAFGRKRERRKLSVMTRLTTLKQFFCNNTDWYNTKIRSKTVLSI